MTATQQDLFASPSIPGGVRTTDPHTSHQAAERQRVLGGRQRMHVLRALSHGPKLDYEIAEAVGILRGSASKRRGELVTAGYVEQSGVQRRTDTGSMALEWRVTDAGAIALRDFESVQ